MKKILILLIIILPFFITGCNKENKETVFKNLSDKITNLSSYKISGNLLVKNNNNSYNYNVEVSFKKNDMFRVSLINENNNHEQIILRNEEGVYVLTPSLNKSFKFQSDWPYNNSQIYLLGSIIEDLNNDSELIKEEDNNTYIFTSKVNYPNNSDLVKQKVYATSDLIIKKIEILNSDGEVEMSFSITNTDYNPTFTENYFEVNSIINDTNKNEQTEKEDSNSNVNENETSTSKTATLDDIIYPLYLPTGTYLEGEEKVVKTDGERVILTFSGEKGFTLVEETVSVDEELTIIPTYGEPTLVNDTIGSMTDNSLNWISGNIEYYLIAENMTNEELLSVANSISLSETVSVLK